MAEYAGGTFEAGQKCASCSWTLTLVFDVVADQHAEYVAVISGDPTNRPSGNPCFGCGRQVHTDRQTPVRWPTGEMTTEAVCSRCSRRYT